MRTPPSRPIIQPPTPLAVEVEVEPVEWEDEVEYDPASVLGEKPGTRRRAGSGRPAPEKGDGGNAEEGFYRLQPATTQGHDHSAHSTGTCAGRRGPKVWVFVDERGRVVADSTRLDPRRRGTGASTGVLIEEAAEVGLPTGEFRKGRAVASWFPYYLKISR